MDDKMKPEIRKALDKSVTEKGIKIIADWLYKAHFDDAVYPKKHLNGEVEKTEHAS